jgi:hypothetical protein
MIGSIVGWKEVNVSLCGDLFRKKKVISLEL